MIEGLSCNFDNNTETLEILYNDIKLVSVPFKSDDVEPCGGCAFGQFCEESIFGSKDIYFMKDFCREAPENYYPDLDRLGIDAEKLYNSIRGKIIKKLPKPKKI